jgi:hypothetical protein
MKLLLAFAFAFFYSSTAIAQSPFIFGAGEAVNLTPNIKSSVGLKLMSGSLDPSATAVNAPAGSMYQSTNGSVYVKQDAGSSTNWLPVGVAAPSSLSTINGQSGPGVTLAAGSAGTDFGITAAANTITFDIPTASAANRGLLSSANWTTFNNKEPAITATSSADYYRGDKTFQPLNKTAVGLSNVDNTSDANKPVSTATQTALDLKADLASPTFTGTVSGITKSMVGLGNVDNTSDADKPISTATQTALDLKQAIVAGVDNTEIGYLNGVTSGIQGQIDGKEPTITVLPIAKGGTNNGSLSVAAGKVLYGDGTKVNSTAAGSSNQVLYGGATPAFAEPQIAIGSEVNAASNQTQIVLPNAQATVQSGNLTTRIESGNKNLLVNPSFEAGSLFDGWAYTGDATSDFSVSRIDGATSANITATADTFTLTQSSTLYQSQFADGIQGLASMWVKSDHSAACEVCSVQAGTPSTVDCVEVNRDGKWGLYKVPFVLGGTSNGVQLSCDSGSGDTYVDDAYVGAPDIIQDSAAVGPWITYTPTGGWTGNTTYAGRYRQVGDSLEFQVFISISVGAPTPAATALQLNMPSGFTVNESKLASSASGTLISLGVARFFDADTSGNRAMGLVAYGGSNLVRVQTAGGGTVTNTNPFAFANGDSVALAFTIPVNELNGNVNTYSAQCGANCVDTLTARVDSSDVITTENTDWLSSCADVTETGQATCLFNTGTFTVAPSCVCTAADMGTNIADITCKVESVSATQVVLQTSNNGAVSNVAKTLSCSKQGADYKNSRTIVGSFKEVNVTAGINQPKTVVAVFGQSGGSLASPSVCSSGTCGEYYDPAGVWTAPAWSSSGVVNNAAIANGTFSPSTPVMCTCQGFHSSAGGTDICAVSTPTTNVLSNSSGGLAGIAIVTTTTAAALRDAFSYVKCTGVAP